MEFSYYSLAIDKNRNSTDMAQLLVFVRGTVSANRRDGVVVRASASQSVDLGSIPLSSHTKRL